MLEVLLFGFLYCLPLLVTLVIGWIMVSIYWREHGVMSVGDVISAALMFVAAWIPLINIMSALLLLYESNQRFDWISRTVIKSRDRQHEETASALRGDR